MEQTIGRKFTFTSLIKFATPTIFMMIFFSSYTVIDGIFVARYVGEAALAAVNVVFPMINITIGIGIMFANGGCALVAKTMGEGETDLARKQFTLLVFSATLIGCILAICSLLFLTPSIKLLGATKLLFPYCYDYARIMMLFAPIMVLKMLFDYFFVAAGKPQLAFYNSILGGVINIVFDYILIVSFDMGIKGAAWATVLGNFLPAAVGVLYFTFSDNLLHFQQMSRDIKVVWKSCYNGASEMVTQLSTGLTTYLFNFLMLKYIGESGVTAITIVLYAEFLLSAICLGFSSGVAPIISYHYGSKDKVELKKLIKYCYTFIIIISLVSFTVAQVAAEPLLGIFSRHGTEVYQVTVKGFHLFAISFLFAGINILTAGIFTAFSNGTISAVVSFMRNFLFIVLYMGILPPYLGINGIWLSVPFADISAIFISGYLLKKYKVFKGYI